MPRRVVILEGESLVNDATKLVGFRVADAVNAGTAAFPPAGAVRDVVMFLLDGLAFILTGLQLPGIIGGLGGYSAADLRASWSVSPSSSYGSSR